MRNPVLTILWIVSFLLLDLLGEGRSYAQNTQVDTVYITQVVRDTVYIPIAPSASKERKATIPDYSDSRMLVALRTNILAIPFMNLGVEVPMGPRWSIGTDIYYPWIGRSGHASGVDNTGVCNELLAADVELRYWFPRRNEKEGERLLGCSVGIYGAAGLYDFEHDWSGYQGEFYNAGLDFLYAAPIFKDRMRLEFEIGLGYIWSSARPYDCPDPGGPIYHRKGVTKRVSWIGPTRAQISLSLPIRVRKKEGGR